MTYKELREGDLDERERATLDEMERRGLACTPSAARKVVFGTERLELVTTGEWIDESGRIPKALRPGLDVFLSSRTDENDVLEDWD